MPLRFDQPSLLGEWKGDPAIIHQALSQMHSASEGEKNRANTKAIADAKLKAKKPSFKIDKVDGSPFSKDQQKMGILINGAMDAINRGENPEPYTEKAQQISNTGKAQKNALDQLKLQTNELQQAYGADVIDTTPISKEINSAYNDHDDETRGVAIGEAAKYIADPSIGMFKADTFYAKKLLDIKPVDYTYSDKNERGIVNEGTDRKVIGRLVVPDTKRPQYERKNGSLSPVLDANGQPVYEMRNASTIDDIIPMVRATFDNDKNAAQWAVNQTLRTEKDEIEKITKNWIDSEVNRPDGGMPDKQTIEAKKQIVARDLTEKKIAKQWLQLDRQGTTTISNTRSLDEPEQSTGGQKDAVAAAVDEAVNIETNIGGVEKRKSIYRPNAIVLPNSKPQNYNLSGDVINLDDNSRAKFTGSTNATLSTLYTRMRIGDKNFIFEAEDKDGNKLPPPTHEKIMQIIRNTPIGTKIKSDVHGIMDIVTKDNTKGVMSQEQIARLEELKRWEKLHPESPRIKDDAETAKKRNELYKLRSETQNPNQTVSAEAVNSGNLFRAFRVKTIEEGARSKKLPQEVRQRFANILEQQKAIEEHNNRTQPKTQSNKGVTVPTSPNNKPKEEEPQKGSFNDIYGKNHMTYVDVAEKHTGNTDELLSKFADWEKKNEGGNGGGYNWGTNDPSIDTKEKAIAKYKKEYLPMVKDLPEGVKNIGLQQAINIGDPWGAALTAAGVYDEKGNSSTAGVRGDNRRAKNQESIYKANQKAVFDSYNKDPEAFKQRYSKAVKYHYDNAKPIGSSNVSDKRAEELRNKYDY